MHFTLKKALKRQECTDSELVTKCTTSTMSNAIPISFFYHSNKNKPLLSTYHVKFSEYMKFRKNLSQTYENMGPKTWQIIQILEMCASRQSLVLRHTFFCKHWQVWGRIFHAIGISVGLLLKEVVYCLYEKLS